MAAAGVVAGTAVVGNESASGVDEAGVVGAEARDAGVDLGVGLVVGVDEKVDEADSEAGFGCRNITKQDVTQHDASVASASPVSCPNSSLSHNLH